MRFDNFEITAPGVFDEPWNEATALGSATWLWMQSAAHRDAPLHSLSNLLLPALKHRQFVLGSEAGKPVFYLSWLSLSVEAEQRYLTRSPIELDEADWHSGERLWVNDWIAPFGHTEVLSRLLLSRVFPNQCARALYHKGEQRGLKIKTFRGIGVIPEQARAWFAAHPLASGA